MPDLDKRSDQEKLLDDLCPIHQTPMVKHQEHVGGGQSKWSEPCCPLCNELKANGRYDQAMASIEADNAKRKADKPPAEQRPAAPVNKPDAAAPAAKA